MVGTIEGQSHSRRYQTSDGEIETETLRFVDASDSMAAAEKYIELAEEEYFREELRDSLSEGDASIAIVTIGDKEYEEFTGKFEIKLVPQPPREERTFAGLVAR